MGSGRTGEEGGRESQEIFMVEDEDSRRKIGMKGKVQRMGNW